VLVFLTWGWIGVQLLAGAGPTALIWAIVLVRMEDDVYVVDPSDSG
jgi:hypothetical protein